MRIKLFFASTLLVFLLTNISFSQSYVFRVLANKGTNQIKKNTGETVTLKTGAYLTNGDEIIASSDAYIGLMHNTGRTVEIKNAGLTKVSTLASTLTSTQSTITSKYAQFVMNKINQGDGNVNNNYRHNMKATGSVERAVSVALKVMLPKTVPPSTVDVLNPEAIIKWSNEASNTENATYIVSIRNIFDEEIYQDETTDTSIKIDFEDSRLKNEKLVILTVKMEGNNSIKSDDYGIRRISAGNATDIEKNLVSLISSENSPLDHLIIASFYEDNNLILDAMTQYEKMITTYPEVDDFKVMYDDFLLKNGIN